MITNVAIKLKNGEVIELSDDWCADVIGDSTPLEYIVDSVNETCGVDPEDIDEINITISI